MDWTCFLEKVISKNFFILFKLEIAKIAERSMTKAYKRRNIISMELLGCPKDSSITTKSYDVVDGLSYFFTCVLENRWQNICLKARGLGLLRQLLDFINNPLIHKDLVAINMTLRQNILIHRHETFKHFIVKRFAVDHDVFWFFTFIGHR